MHEFCQKSFLLSMRRVYQKSRHISGDYPTFSHRRRPGSIQGSPHGVCGGQSAAGLPPRASVLPCQWSFRLNSTRLSSSSSSSSWGTDSIDVFQVLVPRDCHAALPSVYIP